MSTEPLPQSGADFRTRVAAARRERMRARLLEAVMKVSGEARRRSVVIDDVILEAGVSRGAFYRHFTSLEEAMAELVTGLVQELIQSAEATFTGTGADVGLAFGNQLLLYRAALDRPWARFVSSNNFILGDTALDGILRRVIARGVETGAFRIHSLTVAADVVSGGLLAGVRRLGEGVEDAPSLIEDVARHLLLTLGVGADAAALAAATARERLHAEAPGKIAWWRPLNEVASPA